MRRVPPESNPKPGERYEVCAYCVGLDLGMVESYSAIAVARAVYAHKIISVERRGEWVEEPIAYPRYTLTHLSRWPLQTSYTQIAKDTAQIVQQVRNVGRWQGSIHDDHQARTLLVADGTGVGRGIIGTLQQVGLKPLPVVITSSTTGKAKDGWHHVGKSDLVSLLQVGLEQRRLKVEDPDAPDVQVLVNELMSFRRRQSAAGVEQFSPWRESDRDDLVLAVALALYGWTQINKARRAEASRGRIAEAWRDAARGYR